MDLYVLRAGLVKALAHPLRLQILDVLLRDDPKCVCEIGDEAGSSQPTVSKHLAVLREAGVVEARKDGLMVSYQVRIPCVREFFRCIDRVLQEDLKRKQAQLGEVDSYVSNRNGEETKCGD